MDFPPVKRLAIATAAALMAVFLCVSPAAAQQPPCSPHQEMVTTLQTRYSETLVGRGIDALGRMLEIYAGPDGWTVISVQPANMIACVMLIGQKGTQWQLVEPPSAPSS